MKCSITKTYEYQVITCGELVDKLKQSGGDIYCVSYEFIDPDDPCDICKVPSCWDWIQLRHCYKKLYLLIDTIDEKFKIAKK